jgi:Ca2+/Na+ antiporter
LWNNPDSMTSAGLQVYASLALGIVFAAAGGELFVRSAVRLARAARVSGAIIGATVAAFATSSPELAVAINAAIEQRPQIALGDALGSNVVNVALILGIALLISPIQSPRGSVKRDFPMALAVPVAAVIYPIGFDLREVAVALGSGVLAMLVVFPPAHGLIGRGRGAMLMAVYAGYVGAILVW